MNNSNIRLIVAILYEVQRLLKENKKRDVEEFLAATIHILMNGK